MTGQVAQLVERGPEKAGVGGSIPSLATIIVDLLAGPIQLVVDWNDRNGPSNRASGPDSQHRYHRDSSRGALELEN